MTRISSGRDFAAHLEALREVVREEDEPVPALFHDPTWDMMRVTGTRKIKTDASEGVRAQDTGGFLMPDPESLWVHYEVEEEACRFWVQSTPGRTGPFCDRLKEAAAKVQKILLCSTSW
jgi:Choline/Carnitine o-acyltransferase